MEEEIVKDKKVLNSGLIFEPPKPEDYVLGFGSPLQNRVIFKDGHGWLKYQRQEERQANRNFDSYSCVTYASLKALSYYFKVVYNMDMDFSERFTAAVSGTCPGRGNSVRNVLESIRKDGWLLESEYPSMTDGMTQKEWFQEPGRALRNKAKENIKKWKVSWETLAVSDNVNHELIDNALQFSPVIATGYAWASEGDIYKDYGYQANHCFLIADHDENQALWDKMADDSYPQDFTLVGEEDNSEFLKKLAKSYRVWSAHKITVEAIADTKKKTYLTLLTKSMENFFYYWDGHHNFYYIGVPAGETVKYRQKIDIGTSDTNTRFLFIALKGTMNQSSWAEVSKYPDINSINKKFA